MLGLKGVGGRGRELVLVEWRRKVGRLRDHGLGQVGGENLWEAA